ncbi:hypothetical protein NE237_014194 [Protea cynaroides]|uniref:Uncharacterized protein n=1 Tax=Protea cynaroides TaxID=273540 RepID=A0A9Q0JR15_9MAGN|nr:hypothetical protein NE237_014194 [Protea cynaroides]
MVRKETLAVTFALLVIASFALMSSTNATAAARLKDKDFRDTIVHPEAGCRCCYFVRNKNGLLQCGPVCCTDGCCG